MSHIFISYSKQDIDFVRYLRTLLEQEGFAVWVDEARLEPSTRWWKTIEQNVEACAAFVVVMTPDAYESDWVEREILLAENHKKPIYPVLLTGSPWSRLANIQYEDMRAELRARLSPRLVQALRSVIAPHSAHSSRGIEFVVEHGDVLAFEADVMALKHARDFYGADMAVAQALVMNSGIDAHRLHPDEGAHVLLETQGSITSPQVLFVGVPGPSSFTYQEIHNFTVKVLDVLADELPDASHLAMTIHGLGFGLDEIEAFSSQLRGCYEAIQSHRFPPTLQRISVVERNEGRVTRLRTVLQAGFAELEGMSLLESGNGCILPIPTSETAAAPVETQPPPRRHAYVVMPPDADMDDIFYYGIQTPIHALGLLCERIEDIALADDLVNQAKQRIETASVVVADLTGAHPNVCLQLGYAWGKGRPTILLTRDDSALPFAVRGQSLFTYRRIKDVETILSQALAELRAQAAV